MKSAVFAAALIVLAFSIISVPVSAENKYMNFYSSSVVQPGQKINFTGSVYNSSNTSQIMPNINVSATVNNVTNTSTIMGSQVNFTVSAPSAVGEYNVTIYSNDSTIMNKTFTVYVSNITGGSIAFTGKYPPFAAGSSFTINVTLKNATSGNVTVNYVPNVSIFSTNGVQASWNIANLSVKSDANGVMVYNITIPAGVDGQYVIVVEHGVIYRIFDISADYVISAGTEDTSGAASSNFAQGSTINIMAKVRDLNGNPINSTTISNITAYITLSNSTVINKTLSAYPDSAYAGYYNNTINIGTAAGDIGQENIKIVAGVAGKLVDASTLFNVKTFIVKLEMQKEFFEDWGGQAAFEASQNAALNIVPINTTDSSTISPGGAGAPLPACNNTYLQLIDVFYANGTSINSTINNVAFGTGRSMASSVCKISFTAPSNSGTYGMRVNVTISNITVVGETYFSVQKVMMKASSVSNLGGSMDFKAMVTPGENVSVSLTAYNLTSKASITGDRITNIVVTRIVPLEFTGGASEYTDLTGGNNYTVTAGTGTDAPVVSVTLPSTVLGPILVEIRANVSGEMVTGSAFFMANYLEGFLQPQMGRGEGMGGPGGGEMEKSSFSSCSGTITFSGNAREVKSSSAAQGVAISSIAQAREELTGKDVSSYLTIAGSTTSAANTGEITVNVTFSNSYSFSGFYFMLFNASYQGKTTGLPAGFMCKKLNYWPQIMSAGGDQQSWRIAPTGGVNITISDVTRLNDSAKITNRSYVQLPRLMNFNPSKGGMNLLVPLNATAMNFSFRATDTSGNHTYNNITTNKVTFVIYPTDFSLNGQPLTRWPNGFIDLQPVITSVDIDRASDTGMGGFEVVPFDAYMQWSNNNQVSAGDNVSYNVYAKTNISRTEGFTVNIGRPWEGQLANVSNLQYNNTQNMSDGTQVWNVTFTIPSTMKKGGSDLSIEVNNTAGDKSTARQWLTVVKYSVTVPAEEGLSQFDYWNVPVNDSGTSPATALTYGWNMTNLSLTYGVSSKTGNWGPGGLWNGSVMIKNQFNATRYGMTQENVIYNSSTKVLLLDNTTAGTYDTLVLNNSGRITIVNLNRRSALNFTGGGIYLWNIDGTYVKFVNSTTTGSWGGSYQKNVSFKIPYVVKLASTAQPGVSMSVNSIGVQQDGGGNGGFGFSAKLFDGQNYTSSPRYLNTDTNGVAFVDVNISKSGKFIVFWKVNTSSDSDVASMESGTQVEAKSFQTDGGLAYNVPRATAVLTMNNTGGVWKAFGNSTPYVYNGTIAETGGNDFTRDGTNQTWYIVYNPFTNQTRMGTTTDLSGTAVVTINETTNVGDLRIGVNKILKNSTENGTMTMQFYEDTNTGLTNAKMVSSANENVTVKVCANSFDKPNSKPREGGTFYLYVTDWSNMGQQTTTNLTMFDFNGTQYSAGSLPRLGPKGCFALNVTGTWSGFKQMQGNVMYGGDTESVWAGEVFYNQGNWW